jgi:hypothetical protein
VAAREESLGARSSERMRFSLVRDVTLIPDQTEA